MQHASPEGSPGASPSAPVLTLDAARHLARNLTGLRFLDATLPAGAERKSPTVADYIRAALPVLESGTEEADPDHAETVRDYLARLDAFVAKRRWTERDALAQMLKERADDALDRLLDDHARAGCEAGLSIHLQAEALAYVAARLEAARARRKADEVQPGEVSDRDIALDDAARVARACYAPEGREGFVTVYRHTREDGGPEEGGWAYDWLEPVACFAIPHGVDRDAALAAACEWGRAQGLTFPGDRIGDREARRAWSAAPEVDAQARFESTPFRDASTERPTYC